MANERELARSLTGQAKYFLESMGTVTEAPFRVDGVDIDFPYSDIKYAPWDAQIPEGVWESYEAMEEIFNPENMPPHWLDFIKEVDQARKDRGCNGPTNIVMGLHLLIEENPIVKKAGLKNIGRSGTGELDFSDKDSISKTVNTILANKELREEYKNMLSDLVPDVAGGYVEKADVIEILKKAGLKNGIILDLGCGVGGETEEWSQELKRFTVGVDRQYHPHWYDPYWKQTDGKKSDLAYARADFVRGLPFVSESVDGAILQYVVQHVTDCSLERGLKETLRVLKIGGWLFVTPQNIVGHSSWRFFKKELSNDSKSEYYLKEFNYYDIFPKAR